MKALKKMDVIIIAVLLLVSFVPFLIFKVYRANKADEGLYYANITVAGKPYKTIELNKNLNDEFEIKTQYGSNTVEIKNGTIGIIAADCPDSVCIYQGFIDSKGQQIVCLPHKLIITIDGEAASAATDAVAK